MVAVLGGLMIRSHLPAIGAWFRSLVASRGITATTPLGSVRVDPPVPEVDLEAADARALGDFLGTATPSERAGIEEALEELRDIQESRARLDQVWSSDPLNTSEARARRIAERARVLLGAMTDTQRSGALEFDEMDEIDGEPVLLQVYGRFDGADASKALLLVAVRPEWNAGLREATYLDFVRAAQILQETGVDAPVPPFEDWHLRLARKANSWGFSLPRRGS